MLKQAGLLAALVVGFFASGAQAAVVGSFNGPDSSTAVIVNFANNGSPNISTITLGGGTALNINWDALNSTGGTAATPAIAFLPPNNQFLRFSWGATGFASGSTFTASLDPDVVGNPAFGAIVSDLLNLIVTISFFDGSVINTKFIDNPAQGAGLQLAPIPLPAALPLFVTGLGAVWLARRRAARAAAG